MNSRERVLAAVNHQLPDRMPVDAIHVEIQEQLAEHLRVDICEVPSAIGLDGRVIAPAYVGDLPPPVNGVPYTPWGVLDTGDYGTAHDYPFADVRSVRDVETFAWPDPNCYDYATSALQARTLGREYALRGPYWQPLFSRVCELAGMERAMLLLKADPLMFDAVVEHVFACTAGLVDRLLEACGDNLPFATPEQVEREVRNSISALGAGGGYICGPDHHIKPDVPVENAVTLFATARAFRREGYTVNLVRPAAT